MHTANFFQKLKVLVLEMLMLPIPSASAVFGAAECKEEEAVKVLNTLMMELPLLLCEMLHFRRAQMTIYLPSTVRGEKYIHHIKELLEGKGSFGRYLPQVQQYFALSCGVPTKALSIQPCKEGGGKGTFLVEISLDTSVVGSVLLNTPSGAAYARVIEHSVPRGAEGVEDAEGCQKEMNDLIMSLIICDLTLRRFNPFKGVDAGKLRKGYCLMALTKDHQRCIIGKSIPYMLLNKCICIQIVSNLNLWAYKVEIVYKGPDPMYLKIIAD